MVIGTGLGGALGIAPEVTHGTYVAPTSWIEPNKVDIKKRKGVAQGGGLASGRLVQPSTRRVVAFEDGAGSIGFEVPSKGFGQWLKQLFGSTATPVQQAATAAYLQTHTLTDSTGKFASIQAHIPDTSGTARPYTFKGSKITGAEFSCAQGSDDGLLMAEFMVDCREVSEDETLVASSFPTGVRPFHFAQMGVKLGTYNSEAAVDGIKGLSLKIERGHDTERFYANNAGLKSEQLGNDHVKITGSFTADYVDKTILADRFAADSSTSLVWEFIGPVIASTYYETIRFRVPCIFLDGDTPALDGPGVVSGNFPFVGQFDGTNVAVSCEYTSVDTTIA